MKKDTIASVLFVVAIPGYVACFLRHICMCGHLAHFEGSRWWLELVGDGAWFIPLTMSFILGVSSRGRRSRIVAWLAVVLLLSRSLLASGGGFCAMFPELPALFLGAGLAFRQFFTSQSAELAVSEGSEEKSPRTGLSEIEDGELGQS